MGKIDNYWLINQSAYENIKFADTKAASLVALNLAIIAGIHALDVFCKNDLFLFVLACITFCVLAISIICSVKVLFPRGSNTEVSGKPSLCDFNKIADLESYEAYKRNVINSDDYELLEDIVLFIYDRSKINKIKYKWLKLEIIFGVLGWSLSFIIASVTILF